MNDLDLNNILSIYLADVIESLEKNNSSYRIIKRNSDEWNTIDKWVIDNFPLKSFGRINWSEIANFKCYEWWDWEEMCSTLTKVLNEINESKNAKVLLIWSDYSFPFFEVNYESILSSGDVIIDADSDAWIICPSKGWCIEKHHDNEICFGYLNVK